MMASMMDLPLELLLKIGFYMDNWADVHNFTAVVRVLRKCMPYAKYARKLFEDERVIVERFHECLGNQQGCYISRRILPIGDDRVRCYRNPYYDDRVVELWRVRFSWIDYGCKFYEGEISSLTWIYMPYGENFDGREFSPSLECHVKMSYTGDIFRHLCVVEILAAFRQDNPQDTRVPMQNWIQRKNKKIYDNLFARMMFKEMINPKIKAEDYNVGRTNYWVESFGGYKKYCDQAKKTRIRGEGWYYNKHCYPWLNEFREEVMINIRGKMKRKHYFGDIIDVNDFLEK